MRKSAIGDFIDLLSSFVRNEQKARRKFCTSYNAYWQWVKKICFIISFISTTSESAYIPLYIYNIFTMRRIFLSFMIKYNTENLITRITESSKGGELYG